MKTYVSAIKMSGTEKVLLSLCAGPEKQQSDQLYFPSTQNKYTTTLRSPGEGSTILHITLAKKKQPRILRSETISHCMFPFRVEIINPVAKSQSHCFTAIQK